MQPTCRTLGGPGSSLSCTCHNARTLALARPYWHQGSQGATHLVLADHLLLRQLYGQALPSAVGGICLRATLQVEEDRLQVGKQALHLGKQAVDVLRDSIADRAHVAASNNCALELLQGQSLLLPVAPPAFLLGAAARGGTAAAARLLLSQASL